VLSFHRRLSARRRPRRLNTTGAGGDHGIATMENRRGISASSCCEQPRYLHPHPYGSVRPQPRARPSSHTAYLSSPVTPPFGAGVEDLARLVPRLLGGGGESFLRVHWVAVPKAMRARRANRRWRRRRRLRRGVHRLQAPLLRRGRRHHRVQAGAAGGGGEISMSL
jgi:hypothetical protein